jgi:nucleotide-binding universal stress UspA family protein
MTQQALQLPVADGERIEQRDDIGRLVGLMCRHGAPVPAGLPRILIAIDGSDVSNALAATAIAWIKEFHWAFEVHLILVRDFLGKEAAERLLEDCARADSARVREALGAAGVGYTLHVLMGDAATRILERAAAIDATMILMGTRGQGRIAIALLGSVAHKVTHESTIPVTLVRA